MLRKEQYALGQEFAKYWNPENYDIIKLQELADRINKIYVEIKGLEEKLLEAK